MGLNDELAVIMTQILAINLIPVLGNTYHLVVEHERQMATSTEKKPSREATAFKPNMLVRHKSNINQRHDKPRRFIQEDMVFRLVASKLKQRKI